MQTEPIQYIERIHVDICKRKYTVGVGLHSYESQEITQSAVCKLENQEKQCISVQRPKGSE